MGRAGSQRAVHERLEVAQVEKVVAEPRAHAHGGQVVHPVAGHRLAHAQRQLAGVAQLLEHLERAEPAVLVVHVGHAALRGDSQAGAAGAHQLGHGRARVAVAEAPRGGLAQDPGGLAARVGSTTPPGAPRSSPAHARARRS